MINRFLKIKSKIFSLRKNGLDREYNDQFGPLYLIILEDALSNNKDWTLLDLFCDHIVSLGYSKDNRFNSLSSPEDELNYVFDSLEQTLRIKYE